MEGTAKSIEEYSGARHLFFASRRKNAPCEAAFAFIKVKTILSYFKKILSSVYVLKLDFWEDVMSTALLIFDVFCSIPGLK